MNRINYTTSWSLTKVLSLILAVIICISTWVITTEANRIHAESVYAKQWIICKDYVLIRQWPSRKAAECGQLDPGDEIEIDGKTKDGFAHIVSPIDGWVWAGNIVSSQPEKVECKAYVTANKRLYCRRWVDGPKVEERPYLINGSEVRVFWMNDEWAVTSRGYVKSEWLEMMP